MATAKDIILKPIPAKQANELVKRVHYSGTVDPRSSLHIGAFYGGRIEGAIQFGIPIDKRKMLSLVSGSKWNEVIELNRMAFSDVLPKNSESRSLSVSFRLIKKHRPDIRWVISFADATQCGDGAIYRAAGFVLTQIKKNTQIVEFPDGYKVTRYVLTNLSMGKRDVIAKKYGIILGSGSSIKPFLDFGAKYVPGYQLRYIYFLDPTARQRLTVAEIPFSRIAEVGATMYKGHASNKGNHPDQGQGGGAVPT